MPGDGPRLLPGKACATLPATGENNGTLINATPNAGVLRENYRIRGAHRGQVRPQRPTLVVFSKPERPVRREKTRLELTLRSTPPTIWTEKLWVAAAGPLIGLRGLV